MKNFLFYDTEGTGTNPRYDAVLQYAAIRTDENLKEIESFDIRSRLPKHIIPHPQALFVTHTNPYDIASAEFSPFEFAKEINKIQGSYENTTFVGQNILNYDEEIMRTMMWMNMEDPYISSKKGNRRIDTFPMLQMMHALSPGFIDTKVNDNGNRIFKLDQIAPLNGFTNHNAHDALGDDRATIFMYNLIKTRRPELFAMADLLTRQDEVEDSIQKAKNNGEPMYMMLHFGKPEWKCVYPIAKHQKKWGFIDLSHDVRWWANATSSQWFNRAYPYLSTEQMALPGMEKPQPSTEEKLLSRQFQSLAINKQPHIVSQDMLRKVGVDPEKLGIENMPDAALLRQRIGLLNHTTVTLAAQAAMTRQTQSFPPGENIEERLYAGFPSWKDKDKMEKFRDAPRWDEKLNLAGSFEKPDLRQIAVRILFENAPNLLASKDGIEEAIVSRRLYAEPQSQDEDIKWTTIPKALKDAKELHQTVKSQETKTILQWISEQDEHWRGKYPKLNEKSSQKTKIEQR